MSKTALIVSNMDQINVDFCFYDDPDFATNADGDSRVLRR